MENFSLDSYQNCVSSLPWDLDYSVYVGIFVENMWQAIMPIIALPSSDDDDEPYTKKCNNIMHIISVGPKTLPWEIPQKCIYNCKHDILLISWK